MRVAHFYHCYAGGRWQTPVAEHLDALDAGEFDGPFHVGLVGSPKQRQEALEAISARRKPDQIIEAGRGWEQVTLDAVHRYAKRHGGGVLYAHSKGSAHPTHRSRSPWQARSLPADDALRDARSPNVRHLPSQDQWRQVMTERVVKGWAECAAHLEAGYDAAGIWYFGVFHGNFWTARCAYLRKLRRCSRKDRHAAEWWMGTGNPRVRVLDAKSDLHPLGEEFQRLAAQLRIYGLTGGRMIPISHLAAGYPTAVALEEQRLAGNRRFMEQVRRDRRIDPALVEELEARYGT